MKTIFPKVFHGWADFSRLHDKSILVYVLLVAATLGVYWQVLTNGFVSYDDQVYVTANKNVQQGLTLENIVWAFTTGHGANWHPLTWISLLIDYEIFGSNAWGFHFTSLLLHFANTLLLFYVLRRLTGMLWQSAVVAALFALHPLHVESVAWAAERKDVLSTLFWMLTVLAYIRYVEKPEVRRYIVLTITFALGLMAKPMLVTLPLTLLLLDYWPLGRFETKKVLSADLSNVEETGGRKQQKQKYRTSLLPFRNFIPLLREKIPLFVLVVGSSVATFIAQKGGGAVARVSLFTIEERLTNALMSYVRYLGKMIWPVDLAVFYPYRSLWPAGLLLEAGLVLAAISFLAIRNLKRLPYLTVGWLWYIGTLVPVIGLVQVGSQSMADRYTYIPLLGIFVMLVWGISDLVSRWRPRRVVIPTATAAILCALAILTSIQVRTWRDTITLMEHATKVTTDNWVAYSNLGLSLSAEGKLTEAVEEFKEALRIHPGFAEAQHGMGLTLARLGRVDEAIPHYEAALRIKSDYDVFAHANLGAALAMKGKAGEAESHYLEAIRLNPEYAEAHNNYGTLLATLGRFDEAFSQFNEAIRLKPDYQDARNNLKKALSDKEMSAQSGGQQSQAVQSSTQDAVAIKNNAGLLANQGKLDDAIAQYKEALKIKPDFVEAHNELAVLLGRGGKLSEAIDHLKEALRINPDYADARNNLGIALAMQGRSSEAIQHFSAVIQSNPQNANARYNLGLVLAKTGRIDEAITQYREALRIRPDYTEAQVELDKLLRLKNAGR